jgi:predicted RNA-binding Zn-ribbon protein involved in translation (DUF1610 family)
VNCPSCAAEISADARYALLSVCPYCDSAIVLDEDVARIAGKMSALAAPRGPLSVGARGSVAGKGFVVLGRVRYGYERGFWDEWYLRLDEGSGAGNTVWISEDGDDFALEMLDRELDFEQSFESIQPGDRIQLRDKSWHVDEIGVADCEGGEGQLPFVVEQGEKVPFVELSGGGRFATIEFEEEGTRIFFGRRIDPRRIEIDAGGGSSSTLSDEGIAAGGGRKRVVKQAGRSKSLRCESCGAPVDPDQVATDADGATLTCGSCGERVDLSLGRIDCPSCSELVTYRSSEAAATTCPHCATQIDLRGEEPSAYGALHLDKRPKTAVQIGDRFEFRGEVYHVAGYVRSFTVDEGVRYRTSEWLLHSPELGYRYLVCYNGHWSFTRELEERPGASFNPRRTKRKARFKFAGQSWRVFEIAHNNEIDWVEGELNWVAQVGDKNAYMDAVAAPLMLSAEWTDSEMEWYLGEYVEAEEIAKALGKPLSKLPKRKGVAPHQPFRESPQSRQMRWVASLFGLVFLLLGLQQCSKSGEQIAEFWVQPAQYQEEFLSQPFRVTESDITCSSNFYAAVNNSWVYFDLALVNDKDEALFDYSTEISYYHGVDGGESWSEGSRFDYQLFRIAEPGEYRLLLKGEYGDGAAVPLQVEIHQGVGVARYYILVALLCLLWPAIWLIRLFSHEANRWSDD